MHNEKNEKLDKLIEKSIKINDKPTQSLNDSLKIRLYEQENMKKANKRIKLSHCLYFFMFLNIIFCILIGFLATILVKNIYLYSIILYIYLNWSVSGIILTLLGIKRKKLKYRVV